jgi:hypothetical protein
VESLQGDKQGIGEEPVPKLLVFGTALALATAIQHFHDHVVAGIHGSVDIARLGGSESSSPTLSGCRVPAGIQDCQHAPVALRAVPTPPKGFPGNRPTTVRAAIGREQVVLPAELHGMPGKEDKEQVGRGKLVQRILDPLAGGLRATQHNDGEAAQLPQGLGQRLRVSLRVPKRA